MFLFEAPGDDVDNAIADPFAAASSWAGGEYRLYADGGASAVAVSLTAVAGEEATLCTAIEQFVSAASVLGAPAVRCDGASVRLGIAPDPSVANVLVGG